MNMVVNERVCHFSIFENILGTAPSAGVRVRALRMMVVNSPWRARDVARDRNVTACRARPAR
jgi:hypothetical protein